MSIRTHPAQRPAGHRLRSAAALAAAACAVAAVLYALPADVPGPEDDPGGRTVSAQQH